ncbi:SigE family RNA polymerase sigma factor [Micromonospora sp. NBC_01699]|uniref:SigE family RNA polymerase sigma factor n=1 Tax=Micromonospora sp. NBC_01699 TaxID=2975984 RepID=UPI002E27EA3B|nr:SigE family RNA polymerase sigma factor [Micromonospora sp. NBC_01699]
MRMAKDPAAARDQGFRDFYLARGTRLRATAYLLCGDWHLAEDLVQAAFTKLYLAWPRIYRYEHLDQYAHRTLLNTFFSERRRSWRREDPVRELPTTTPSTTGGDTEDRLVLIKALAALPDRQRATLVLRFFEDMSVEQTADLLGISTGAVKTHTSRALATLRTRLGSLALVPAEENG